MTYEELGIINDMPRGWINEEKWHRVVYNMWRGMHNRVKNPDSQRYQYYKDSKIHSDYDYLSKYVDFIESEPRFEEFKTTCHKVRWNVDKDMKCKDNKNYYPEFMTLCIDSENTRARVQDKGNSFKKEVKSAIGFSSDKIFLFYPLSRVVNVGLSRQYITTCCKYNKIYKGYKWKFVNYKHNKRYRKVVK